MAEDAKKTKSSSLATVLLLAIPVLFFATVITKKTFGVCESCEQPAKTQIRQFGEALQLYKIKNGEYPSSEEGLAALTRRDAKGRTFMDAIPQDPWGNDYVYQKNNNKFEIISYGADGVPGGEGDDDDIRYSGLGAGEDE